MKPLYVIDHAALAGHPDPMSVVEHLADCMAKPGWKREPLCRACDRWQTKDGLDNYPRRPGAAAPHESCNGCWYSYLDDPRQLARERKRQAGKSKPRRRRAVRTGRGRRKIRRPGKTKKAS